MRWLFIACSTVIAFVYYIGARRSIKDMETFNQGMVSTLYALTGRNSEGQFAAYPSGEWRDYPSGNVHVTEVEDEEEETPYYFPPGLPKEEPYQEIGYLK